MRQKKIGQGSRHLWMFSSDKHQVLVCRDTLNYPHPHPHPPIDTLNPPFNPFHPNCILITASTKTWFLSIEIWNISHKELTEVNKSLFYFAPKNSKTEHLNLLHSSNFIKNAQISILTIKLFQLNHLETLKIFFELGDKSDKLETSPYLTNHCKNFAHFFTRNRCNRNR